MGYAIACGHEVTAKAAEEVLKDGGNAIDAAIAAFTSSWVAEPCMSGPGGGGFAVLRFKNKFYALDFFAATPKKKKPIASSQYIPVDVDFGDTTERFYTGYGSIAIPGAIDGIFKLHSMGATMPMSELLHSSIKNSKEGVVLNDFQYHDMFLLRDILRQSERGKVLFFRDDNIAPEGTTISMPYLADFIDYMGREGRDSFYQGEIASIIAKACRENGGHIRLSDLKNYESRLTNVVKQKFHNAQIVTIGVPSIGGLILNQLLEELSNNDFYSNSNLIKALMKIDEIKRAGVFHRQIINLGGVKEGGTSHISIVDQYQNAISISMSLGEGSGRIIPGTDIHLNNMLGEESLLPNGIHSWREGNRMSSMMTPTLLVGQGNNEIGAVGSGGASRIPTMIGQMLYHHVVGKLAFPDAISHPRTHLINDIWQVEPGFPKPPEIPEQKWKKWNNQSLYFGGTHCAAALGSDYVAIGDPRRSGVGFIN